MNYTPNYPVKGTSPGTAHVTKTSDIVDAFIRGHLTSKHPNLNTHKPGGTLELHSYSTIIATRTAIGTAPDHVIVVFRVKRDRFSVTTSRAQNALRRDLSGSRYFDDGLTRQHAAIDPTSDVFVLAIPLREVAS